MQTCARVPEPSGQAIAVEHETAGRARFGHGPEVHPLLHLQSMIGNQAVQRMSRARTEGSEPRSRAAGPRRFVRDVGRGAAPSPLPGGMQAKLTVNTPGDAYEQEADRVSEQVMRMPEPQLQRACACGETFPADQGPERLQTKRAQADAAGGIAAPSTVHQVLRSSGQPLDAATRNFMEPRFGYDFSRVRVHSGTAAQQSAREVNAQAYTVGHDIVFGAAKFAPGTTEGRQLLAHELAHVVQQGGGSGSNIVQRREVDDRSCAGLSDAEGDVDNEVNSQINTARTAVGTSPAALLPEVYKNLGDGIISPIETFIDNLPAGKRNTPAGNLSGTKYAGAGAVNFVYKLGLKAVASAAKIHNFCIGADKLGHFFDLGFKYWQASVQLGGMSATQAQDIGRATEIAKYGLALTGVYSRADQEANLKGWQFYKDLEADPTGYKFAIANYIAADWNEQSNTSFYEANLATVVWNNLLAGKWRGTIGFATKSPSADIQFDLAITTGGVAGSYEYPVGAASPNKGTIANGVITQRTTTVAGQLPGDPVTSATAVSGISIEFTWHRGTSFGKGVLNSTNEQTLDGTWGAAAATSGGGTLNKLRKI